MDTAPKASGCFLGGTQEIFGVVSEDLLGGAGKAEDAKLPGAGIIPKPCPMERVGTENMNNNKSERPLQEPDARRDGCERAVIQGPGDKTRTQKRRATLHAREKSGRYLERMKICLNMLVAHATEEGER